MKQIASKGRLILRKILTALSLGAVSFVFQACYGMPMDEVVEHIHGTVKSDNEEPIPGIQVQVSTPDEPDAGSTITATDGSYSILVYETPSYTVLFEDIDGPENGGEFESTVVTWQPGDGPLNVTLSLKE